MKKLLLSLASGLIIPLSSFAQGSILLQNVGPGFTAQLQDLFGCWISTGDPFTVELLAGTSAGTVAPFAPPITTDVWITNGWFGVGEPELILPGFPPGSFPFLQIRVWENADGSVKSYVEAAAKGLFRGQSVIWQLPGPPLTGGLGNPLSNPPMPGPPLFGLTRFSCLCPPPRFITSDPANQAAFASGTATFLVNVWTHPRPVTFQWQFASLQTNWVDIADATNSSLVISPVSEASEGAYRVVTKAKCVRETSLAATLRVGKPPRFESYGLNPANGSFSFIMSSEPGLAFIVDASTNLVDWAPFLTVTNTSGSLMLSDSDAPNLSHRFYRAMVR